MRMEMREFPRRGAGFGMLALLVFVNGCGDGSTPPELPVPLLLMGASPPAQSAEVGSEVVGPFVFVAEKDGLARVQGVIVNFTLTGGGMISPTVDTTDANGLAKVETWTLGDSPGVSVVTATSPSVPDTSVVFTAEGRAAATASGLR